MKAQGSVLAAFLIAVLGFTAFAGEQDKLTVEVSLFEPCVMKGVDGNYTGFDIELWETIAEDLGLEYEYREVEFPQIFKDLPDKKADLAVAGITINQQREEFIDFSHRYLDSGLTILVRSEANTSVIAGLIEAAKSILSKRNLIIFFAVFVLFWAHLAWFAERGSDAINDSYYPGILESIWWTIVTMSTVGYGDIAPKQWFGRVVASFVILTGISFFCLFTAEVASIRVLSKLESSISCPEDLQGKVVATAEGTTSVQALRDLGAKVVETPKIEGAYEKLLKKEVEAVVFDAPGLLYYGKREGAGKVTVVGGLFDTQDYGIAFPQGSPYREQVNRVLLKLRKNGVYDRIYKKWFGEKTSKS